MPYSRLLKHRISVAGASYHVCITTKARRPIFADDASAEHVAAALLDRARLGDCENHAWVVMPDHVHWLFELADNLSLSQVVSACKAQVTRNLHATQAVRGSVWQSGYFEHQVRIDDALLRHARYLVANPLRAGLVRHLVNYRWWFAHWAPPPHGPVDERGAAEALLMP